MKSESRQGPIDFQSGRKKTKYRETKAAIVIEQRSKRRKLHIMRAPETCRGSTSSIQESTGQCMCIRKISIWEKRLWRGRRKQ